MATTKPKTAAKKTAAKPKTAAAKKTVKTVKPVATPVETKTVENKGIFSGFFGKKYEENESILTIFKKPTLYGALLGEILGTMLLTLVLFAISMMGPVTLGQYATFAVIAILIVVYGISGAQLNPIITAGMMATRRMSVIRGVLYIIAQIIGAWLGWMIFNAFCLAGGDSAYPMPAMAAVAEGNFGIVTAVEFLGAAIIGFFATRATAYKRSAFTSAAVVAGGIIAAIVIGYVVSAAFLGLSNNFAFNPAVALMYQIFPTAGEGFGEIFGGVCSALATYALFPMIGGILGAYIADFASKLSGEKNA